MADEDKEENKVMMQLTNLKTMTQRPTATKRVTEITNELTIISLPTAICRGHGHA